MISTIGMASNTTVISVGKEIVESGGTSISATLDGIEAAGLVGENSFSAGGTAIGLVVSSGGDDLVLGFGEQHDRLQRRTGECLSRWHDDWGDDQGIAEAGLEAAEVISAVAALSLMAAGGADFVYGLRATRPSTASGIEVVNSGGSAIGVTVSSGSLSSDQVTVSSGGYAEVLSGQSANDIQVLSGGTAQIDAGATVSGGEARGLYVVLGTATSVSIESGGTTVVEGGGNAANTTVATGGTEIVGAGGTATGIVVSSGGTLELFGGAVATGFDIEPGGNLVLGFGFPLLVSSGQVASAITVLSNTQLTVTSGGTANGTVLSGGTLVVADGALADPTLIFSGGSEVVNAGGIDEGALVSGGAQIVYGLASGVTVFTGSQVIESGGSAIGTTISNGGEVEVLLGGIAQNVSFVGSGGVLEIYAPSGLSGIIDVSETGSIDFVSASVIGAGISGSTLVVTEAGSETFSYQLGSLQAGTSVSLQSDGNNGTDVVLQAPVVSGTSLTITASPNSVPADGAATTTLTVTVEDAKGNLLANTAVTLSASGADNSFGSISGVTNAEGVFTTTLASTLAQTETITASEGGVQETTSVSFVAGGPSAATSTLVANPGSVAANGTATTTLTVTVEDAKGNLLANTAVTLSASGADNSFGSISGVTNAEGVFTTTLASTLAQTETVTASEGGVQETTSVSFGAGGPSAATSTLVANPGSVAANGTATTTLTVTVEDAKGNLLANTAVTLSASGADNSFGSISGVTNAEGVFTTTLASTLAQTETITASEGGVQETTSVSFVAGGPSAATSTLVANPGSVAANGTATTTLTVTVEDAKGNLLANTAVTLSASGADNSFGSISGVTNAEGVFTTTLASTLAQTETITASEGGVQETTSVTFAAAGAPVVKSITASGPGIVHGNGDLNAGKTVILTVDLSAPCLSRARPTSVSMTAAKRFIPAAPGPLF